MEEPPAAQENVSVNNPIMSTFAVFSYTIFLMPYLTVFNSSGVATCLVISIGNIPELVSYQPHFIRSSALSPLRSCI